MITDDKVYTRDFNPDSGESLALVAKHIPHGSRVLDIGCGAGDLGQYLRNEKRCYVIGMDYSTDSLAVAKEKLDATLQIDLNTQQPHNIVNELFDVIVMADILEHIHTPEAVLQSAEKCLKPEGKVLISIPNAGYVGALLSLYDDSWQYREEGILDRTHIRFYTYKSTLELLADNGFDGTICDRVIRDLWDSEFTQRMDNQTDGVRDWLLAKPEGATYQFIIEARPVTQQYSFSPIPPAPSMSEQHIVKLYWQTKTGATFTPKQSALQRGVMGKSSQLQFVIPDNELRELRLDFADRRSIYYIEKIAILDGEKLLWSTQNAEYLLRMHHLFSHQQRLPLTAMAHNAQAFLLFILPEIQHGEALTVEVILRAPISEQNTTFLDAVSLHQYNAALEEQQRLANELAKVHKETGTYLGTLETTLHKERIEYAEKLATQENEIFNLSNKSANFNNEAAQFTSQISGLNNEISTLNQMLETQKYHSEAALQKILTEHEETRQQLNNLLQSNNWKLTSLLRKIIHLFK